MNQTAAVNFEAYEKAYFMDLWSPVETQDLHDPNKFHQKEIQTVTSSKASVIPLSTNYGHLVNEDKVIGDSNL
jgi:hypothetical protein